MKSLLQLPFVVRVLIVVILLGAGLGAFSYLPSVAYITLFLGLFVAFEAFGFSLFIKILLALVLGGGFAASGLISSEQFDAMKPIGSQVFLNLLTIALVPLVFSSILTGVTQLADMSRLQRIGLRAIAYFICTTIVAVTIGLVVANIAEPGKGISEETKGIFEQQVSQGGDEYQTDRSVTLLDVLKNLVPKNILMTVSQSRPDMLAIILFAVFCGLALLRIDSGKAAPVIAFFEGVNEMTIQIINMVMRVAPYGVFTIIGATLSQSAGFEVIFALLPFSLVVLSALFIHALVVNSISLRYLSQRPFFESLAMAKEVLLTAFSTASSGATMPFTMSVVEEKFKVKKEVSSFVISLGATINMDGTSLFQGVAAIFLANLYGIDLSMMDQVTIVVMAVLASIGTAAVPGVGIVMLMMILSNAGVPSEGILFILPVNHILDMFRTAVNVLGDMCCALYINKVEGAPQK